MLSVKSKQFINEGMKLNYYEFGKGAPILFLPGAGVSVLLYRGLIEGLAKDHRVVAIDLPGFGRSTMPPLVWDLRDYSIFVQRFVESLKLTNLTVIGHSFGGGVGLCLAEGSLRVSRLIVMNSLGGGVRGDEKDLIRSVFLTRVINDVKLYRNPWGVGRLIWYFWLGMHRHLGMFSRIVKIIETCCWEKVEVKRPLTISTLIIHSSKDELISFTEVELLRNITGRSDLIIVDGNHDWQIFEPGKCEAILREYLSK